MEITGIIPDPSELGGTQAVYLLPCRRYGERRTKIIINGHEYLIRLSPSNIQQIPQERRHFKPAPLPLVH
jgi:hypothetical protein